MINADEAAFLRSIADRHEDDAPRLIFADWLDERGESTRAEFIRLQCELASPGITDARRRSLREREREILEARRNTWCESLELPVADVSFDRGVIDKLRITKWNSGALLDPACLWRLATVTELDLSALQLNDADVAAFAKAAEFLALKRLYLNDNAITDAGARALAAATGLPRLETLFLFGNMVGAAGLNSLTNSTQFTLGELDTGERQDGYCMSPGQAEMARRQYVREQILPVAARYFAEHERLRSAMLCVAQYWADEADDAVHARLIVSELFEPTLAGVSFGSEDDPNIPNTNIPSEYGDKPSSAVSLWDAGASWDDNNGAIPLWAAYAPEDGSQEYDKLLEVYRPAVLFYRHGGYEFLPMARPHLNGVRPTWGWDD